MVLLPGRVTLSVGYLVRDGQLLTCLPPSVLEVDLEPGRNYRLRQSEGGRRRQVVDVEMVDDATGERIRGQTTTPMR